MTRTSSRAALLRVCIQDLHAGKRLQAERLGGLARHASEPALQRMLEEEIARAGAQAERLAELGVDVEGPDNLWMSGILDDAERDTRSVEPGHLLDVAVLGAVRKAKASEIVSSETAIALAEALDMANLGAAVHANRAEEVASDRMLRALLMAIAQTPG